MFIGDKEIKMTLDKGDNTSEVSMDGGYSTIINNDLLKLISSEEKGSGNITDHINDYFAKKFVAELASYDLNYYFAENIGVSMGVLVHNLREVLLKNTFNCTGGNDIPLKTLVMSKKLDKE